MSVGLEAADEIVEDLEQALEALRREPAVTN
jgi:cystathionine beta-lyase/cystathionine gamma-synthase